MAYIMKLHPIVTVVFLLASMQMVSAFKMRCWMFCSEQTGIQTDYVADRDSCRDYAQLRVATDTATPELMEEKSRKAKLIAIFSACMADKNWTVPDGKASQQPSPPVPIPTPGQPVTPATAAPMPVANSAAPAPAIATAQDAAAMAQQRREKTFLARTSECAFARHGAPYSSVSATRAKACDIECAQRLKAAPDAPRPAACPADPNTLGN